MKKIFALVAMVAMVFAVTAQAEMALNVESVNIHLLKKTGNNNTLGGPGGGPGTSDFCMDAYTAPTWATTAPSVFSIEQYSFSGGVNATVDHRTIMANNAQGGGLTSLAYAWVECGAGNVYPPVPNLLGTTLDGSTLALSLPYTGVWYVTVGISGFSTGTYDWGWMARYDGVTPIPVPPNPPTDLGGFEFGPGATNSLHNLNDQVGDGTGSGRPWCFQVNP
jgi:hypothetical protein